MNITKAKLIKKVKDKLHQMGYFYLKDTVSGADGLFIKQIKKGYFLTLGFVISRQIEDMFTASFYLSKNTRWGSIWSDIPRESYQRISKFLSDPERKKYLNKEYHYEGMKDAWWNFNSEKEIENFYFVLEIVEPRFISQEDLLIKIEKSDEINCLQDYSNKVKSSILDNNFRGVDYHFVPDKSIDDTPIQWFMAAENVLSKNIGHLTLNKNTVKLLAIDSWRQSIFGQEEKNE